MSEELSSAAFPARLFEYTAAFARISFDSGRTFANLVENLPAVFMIMDPGAGILDWKGILVYLKMLEFATSGHKLDAYKSQMAKIMGEQAAGMIAVLATLRGNGSEASDRFWARPGEGDRNVIERHAGWRD